MAPAHSTRSGIRAGVLASDASEITAPDMIPRGPRCSRATPDKLVERITKRKAGVLFTSGPLSNANWAAALTANKARKTAITNPAHKRMVSWLEAKAERSEKMAIDSMIEHILESPPPVKSERCQLTLVKDEARRPGVSPGKIVAIGMDAVVSPGPQ